MKIRKNFSLTRKVKGFSGITHMLIATLLFQIIWMTTLFSGPLSIIRSKGMIGIGLFWGIVIGSALLPDLDNDVSTAKYQLGILGQILSMFMVLMSSVVTTILRGRNDKIKSQHRLLWHTPFICFVMYLIVVFFHPQSNYTLWNLIQSKFTYMNISSSCIVMLFFILSCSGFYLTVNFVCYKAGKILARGFFSKIKVVLTLAAFVYLGYMVPINYLRIMAFGVCLGSLFHNIGDLFSLGSIPIIFPIPIKNQFWWKPHLPFQLETGGVMNRVLDFILFIIVIAIFLIMFGVLSIS